MERLREERRARSRLGFLAGLCEDQVCPGIQLNCDSGCKDRTNCRHRDVCFSGCERLFNFEGDTVYIDITGPISCDRCNRPVECGPWVNCTPLTGDPCGIIGLSRVYSRVRHRRSDLAWQGARSVLRQRWLNGIPCRSRRRELIRKK